MFRIIVLIGLSSVVACANAQVIDVRRLDEVEAKLEAKKAAGKIIASRPDQEKLDKALKRRDKRRDEAKEALRNRNADRNHVFAIGMSLPVARHTRPFVVPQPSIRASTGRRGRVRFGSTVNGAPAIAQQFVAAQNLVTMRILFLDDPGSTTGDTKENYLRSLGHSVYEPVISGDDFATDVAAAQVACREFGPDVIVGAGRGGAIAIEMDPDGIPLVLLAPAWKAFGTSTTIPTGTIILHSRSDAVVPFADSQELVATSGLDARALLTVGIDHDLDTAAALATLQAACLEVTN